MQDSGGGRPKGLVMVFTGDGKGKTTAALGQALRAIGHGGRVYMVQFMKGDERYGELQAARKYLPPLTLVQSGLSTFVTRGRPGPEDLRLAARGLELAREALTGGEYDLVVLDEVNVAIDYGLLSLEAVLETLHSRAPGVDVVLTGRYAPQALIAAADMVSEVREVKHHYRQGVPGRRGIEF
ncbi:MAG: cob(I)yrinic acid a,c-diamide adenosyltransferase [Acetobacteraceae bacterium]|nr:cob(I)yrinic acid a,c-diamide adenosyltransferase [Acetobacteraceae bacterium]